LPRCLRASAFPLPQPRPFVSPPKRYPPFESIDANNKIVGFDVDLANALCKEIDATCTFTNQAFDSLIPSLKFRRFDAVMAGMDITPEREKQVLFPPRTMTTPRCSLVKREIHQH
jgi:ABC-type amino acid transport substrate-binding protein